VTDLELTLKALEAGILPSFDSAEIKGLLETCDPEQARRMKRKFRKLWRKSQRQELREARVHSEYADSMAENIRNRFKVPARRRRSVKNQLIND